MSGQIVRLVAGALIMVTAFLLYQQHHKELKFEQVVSGCADWDTNPEKSIEDCTVLLDFADNDPVGVSAAYLFRGRARTELGDYTIALEEFQRAASANPKDCRVWHWKSFAFGQVENVQAAFDAIERANAICPTRSYTIQQRILLLKELGQHSAADAYMSELVEKNQSVTQDEKVRRQRRLGGLFLDVDQFAFASIAYREALLADLSHKETFQKFFESCAGAGAECPALYPERRSDYPALSCQEAITQWVDLNPKFAETILPESGFDTLHEFFEEGGLPAQVLLQAAYLSPAASMFIEYPSEYAVDYIVSHRVFDCVNDGKFVFPEGVMTAEELRFANENLFSSQMRQNYLDLAHAALDE